MPLPVRCCLILCVACFGALVPSAARASFASLAQRLPPAANVMIAINVERVLSSPLATKDGWRQDVEGAWEKQPMMVPAGAARVLYVSSLNVNRMDPYWEMALIEMDNVPSAEDLAKAEGGQVDKVWDKMAAHSPIDAYFVPLDAHTLASITPAERSNIARWVRQPLQPGGQVTSEYVRKAVTALDDNNTDIAIALDVEGAFSVPNIRRFLNDHDFPEIPEADRDRAATLLGTIKGLTLDVRVDKDITGKVTFQFDRETFPLLAQGAKPLTLAVLNQAGMRLDDLKAWTFTAEGKQVRAEGKLSRPALRQLLSVVETPIPAKGASAKGAVAASSTVQSPAAASQRYYKSICAMLDGLSQTASPADTATWARNAARRIDQLPILNVDPALLEWGGMVGSKLKEAGGVMGVAQTQMNSRINGVADYDAGGSWDSGGEYHSNYSATEAENTRKQRRQIALEQKGQAQEKALAIMQPIAETRPKIRAEMTAKYNVEF
jgi:hypothetical protein